MTKFSKISLSILLHLFVLTSLAQTESINQTDDQNKKQGHWIFTNKEKHLPGYTDDQKIEEGNFINNKKEGKWTFYFNNEKPKHILNYKDGTPEGEATFYYKNGNVREKGTWKNNRWIGEYKMYYRDGTPKNHFNYNLQGLKEGKQIYYHENGKPSLIGTWENGNETGDLAEYNLDGSPKTNRFEAGPPITETTTEKVIETPDTIAVVVDSTELKIRKAEKKDKPITPFNGNGYHEFKDRYGNKTKVGEFLDGLLVDGKIYKYDPKGKLLETKIVRDGSIVKVIKEKK